MKYWLTIVFGLTAVSVLVNQKQALAGSIPFRQDQGVLVGMGYDSLTGEFKNTCVQTPPPVTIYGNQAQGGQSLKLELDFAETSEQLAAQLEIDAKASMGMGTFGGDAGVSYLNSTSLNSYHLYLTGKVTVTNFAETLPQLRLTDEGVRLLNKNPRLFHQTCGDSFIYSRSSGGELDVVFEFMTNSSSEKESLKASLEAGGLTWSASLNSNFQNAVNKQNIKYKLTFLRQGDVQPVKMTVDQLVEEVLNFNQTVSASSGKAWFYSLGVMPYESMAALDQRVRKAPPNPDSAGVIHQSMKDLQALHIRFRQYVNDIQYVLENPNLFFPPLPVNLHQPDFSELWVTNRDSSDLMKLLEQYKAYDASVMKSYNICVTDWINGNCNYDSQILDGVRPPVLPAQKPRFVCDEYSYTWDNSKSVLFAPGGDQEGTRPGASCATVKNHPIFCPLNPPQDVFFEDHMSDLFPTSLANCSNGFGRDKYQIDYRSCRGARTCSKSHYE